MGAVARNLAEGVAAHNLAEEAVVHNLAEEAVVHNLAEVDRTPVEGPAHNLAEEAVDHIHVEEVGHIPGGEEVVADHIRPGRHTARGAELRIVLEVHHDGNPVHLACHMKNRQIPATA